MGSISTLTRCRASFWRWYSAYETTWLHERHLLLGIHTYRFPFSLLNEHQLPLRLFRPSRHREVDSDQVKLGTVNGKDTRRGERSRGSPGSMSRGDGRKGTKTRHAFIYWLKRVSPFIKPPSSFWNSLISPPALPSIPSHTV